MKLFSILNKPSVKANNKQAGIVFLEYVIMAFIVTVAVICALWWFYWHLQQMTWQVKQKLDTLKTLNCELGKPEGDQPTPAGQGFPYNITEWDIWDTYPEFGLYKLIPIAIPYSKLTITVKNIEAGKIFGGWIDFRDAGYTGLSSVLFYFPPYGDYDMLSEGDSETFSVDLSGYYGTPPYYIGVDPLEYGYDAFVSVNVTETTP